MNPFTTFGAISWPELQTSDPKAAVEFYKKVFSWNFEAMPMPSGDYHVGKFGDEKGGLCGIFEAPEPGMPTAWMFYVTVENAAATAEKATELGGTIILPPMEVPTIGTLLGIQDPTGAVIMAMQYSTEQQEADAEIEFEFEQSFGIHGMFSWYELRTPDVAAASTFYSSLFGWDIEEVDMPGGMKYMTCKIGDVGFGGLVSPPSSDVPPHWGAYVTVDDVDATAKAVADAGGTLMVEGMDIEGVGRISIFNDPTGGSLGAVTYVASEVDS